MFNLQNRFNIHRRSPPPVIKSLAFSYKCKIIHNKQNTCLPVTKKLEWHRNLIRRRRKKRNCNLLDYFHHSLTLSFLIFQGNETTMVYSCPCLLSRTKRVYGWEVLLLWKTPNHAEHKYPIDTINASRENLLPAYTQFLQNELKSFQMPCFSSFHLCSFHKILKMIAQCRFWHTPDVAWMNFWDSSSHKLVFGLNSNSQRFSAGRHILRLWPTSGCCCSYYMSLPEWVTQWLNYRNCHLKSHLKYTLKLKYGATSFFWKKKYLTGIMTSPCTGFHLILNFPWNYATIYIYIYLEFI